ncbi:VOC family protein [Streptomyces sp. NPDC003860]
MAGSSVQINALIVDATDPEQLAAFWSELLGRPIVGRTGPYVWLWKAVPLQRIVAGMRTSRAASAEPRLDPPARFCRNQRVSVANQPARPTIATPVSASTAR